MRFAADPGRRPGVHPAARSAADGQLSVTEFRRVRLCDRRHAQRRAGRRPETAPRGDPAPRLSRIAPHLARRRAAARGPLPPDHARPARLRRVGPAAGGRRPIETDKLVADIFALADALGLERFALVGHDWGGAIAWPAALRSDPRLTRLAIVNAPHPVIFQKSLIEDADQRAASQYINSFRTPGFEKAIEAMGFDAFFEKTFGSHVDLAHHPRGREAAIYRRMVAAGRD